MNTRFLDSFVRRGAVALLVLAAALTLATTDQARRMLGVKAGSAAADLARAHAAALADRLAAAERALRLVQTAPAGDGAYAAAALPYVNALAWVDAQGNTRMIHGPAGAPLSGPWPGAKQSPGTPPTAELAFRAPAPGGGAEGMLLMRLAGPDGSGNLVAQLNNNFLWPMPLAGLGGRHACILDDTDATVMCSAAPLPEEARRQVIAARGTPSSGILGWDADGASALGGRAQPSLPKSFAPTRLTVVVWEGSESLASTVAAHAWRFVPAIFLVLFPFALIILGRRGPSPHAEPGGATVRTPSVAPAIAPPQQRQLKAMAVMAGIDRAILSRAHAGRLVDLVLDGAPEAIGCDVAAITLLERHETTQARTFVVAVGAPKDRTAHRSELDGAVRRMLAREPDGCLVEAGAAAPFLKILAARGAHNVLVLPVFVDAGLTAVLSAGFAAGTLPDATTRLLARDFADRLGVALTAAAHESDLYRQVNYDPTTALPNQRLLRERLAQEIARAQREASEFALMFVDLDQFKKVNDVGGHQAGDTVLEQAARRMMRCLRAEDVLARFGGDEFVVLLPAIAKGTNAARVAEKLVATLSEPYVTAGQEHFLGASIGISVFPQDGRTSEKLMRNADFAMYRAKTEGRGRYVFFDEGMNTRVLDRAGLDRDLRTALANGELTLAYQPQIDLATGRVTGAEALARWQHPQRGAIPPDVFIEIAEQSNLIEAIGQFVRETACAQYLAWQARGLVLPRIALNVSSREVRRADFVEQIQALLAAHGMRPLSLELEITESLLLDSADSVIATLRTLHEMGVRLAIDDFGTGYSSMAYLKNLPFDVLKIDRSFVKDLGTRDGSEAIVTAILGVARGLGKDVVAEGIETEEQRAFLFREGCEAAQGYLWSRPLAPEAFETMLRGWVAVPHRPVLVHSSARLVSA